MDENGIEMMLLSLNAPAVQAIPDPKRANELRAPTISSPKQVAKRPDRFQALAALADAGPGLAPRASCSAA